MRHLTPANRIPTLRGSDLKAKRCLWLFLGLAILLVGFIWGNSMLSKEASSDTSGAISAWLKRIIDPDNRIAKADFHATIRKIAHFVEFMMLGLCCGGFFACYARAHGKYYYSLAVLTTLIVAVLDEWIQYFADRGSMVTDVVLDFIGAATGLGLVFLVVWIRKKHHGSLKER